MSKISTLLSKLISASEMQILSSGYTVYSYSFKIFLLFTDDNVIKILLVGILELSILPVNLTISDSPDFINIVSITALIQIGFGLFSSQDLVPESLNIVDMFAISFASGLGIYTTAMICKNYCCQAQ